MSPIALRLRINRFLTDKFATRMIHKQLSKPIISFTFDDFPRSALLVGGKLLNDFGLYGTYYASAGLMGSTTEVGEIFQPADLNYLLERGHELACHTYGHIACNDLTHSELMDICALNRGIVAKMTSGYQLRNFSFPFGAISLPSKTTLSSLYETCRGIEPGINHSSIDLACLRAYGFDSPDILNRVIRENVQLKGWLILYTHDVTNAPSTYGCTPECFLEIVRRAIESGAEILTIKEALSRLVLGENVSSGRTIVIERPD